MGLLDKLLQSEETESSEHDVTNSKENSKRWFPSCFIYTRFGVHNKVNQLVKPRDSDHWHAITSLIISGPGEIGERCVLNENLSNHMLIDIKPRCYQPAPKSDRSWIYFECSEGIKFVNDRSGSDIEIFKSFSHSLLAVTKLEPYGDWITAPDWLLEHLIKDM